MSSNSSDSESAYQIFASKVKTLSEVKVISLKGRVQFLLAVNHVDVDMIVSTLSQKSATYDATLHDFEQLCDAIFVPGETWSSRDLITKVVNVIGSLEGWCAGTTKRGIYCNRMSRPDSIYLEDTVVGKTKRMKLGQNCKWLVSLKALVTERYYPVTAPGKDKPKRIKPSYKDIWEQPVLITKTSCRHTGDCEPCRSNLIAVSSSSGRYMDKLSSNAVYTLCNYHDEGVRLSHQVIKAVITPVWPKQKPITGQTTFNIRIMILRLVEKYRSCNTDYDLFKEVANDSELLGGLDNQSDLTDDEVYDLFHSICQEITTTGKTNEEMFFSFREYMHLLATRCKGFSYKVLTQTSGLKKDLLGIIWMTATMRRNFELFGSFISLDMMKRGLNKMLFPYTAVTMLDESTNICLACEGIVIGELDEMYKAQANFLMEFAPGRPLDRVLVVAGDGFFDNDSIHKMGFVNANFIHDQWHLFDSGLSKNLGKAGFLLLKKHLRAMIQSDSVEDFDQVVDLGVRLIKSEAKIDGQLLSKFLAFAKRRKHYSNYCLCKLPGNRERHGSGISESNNSSLLSYLNDGKKGVNDYNMHAHEFCRDVLGRQSNHVNLTNQRLFNMHMKLKVELRVLSSEPRTTNNDILIKAASKLNLPTYQRFKTAVERGHEYSWTKSTDNDTNVIYVQSLRRTDAPPRRLCLNGSFRCDCKERVSYLEMCVHEICCFGFREDMFEPWHFKRERVQGSMIGWIRPEDDELPSMFDFDSEPVIQQVENGTTRDFRFWRA